MNKETEEAFERLGEKLISDAEAVKCEFAEFVEGLKDIESTVRDRRVFAEEELKGME